MNDKYYRLLNDIPDDFDCEIYKTRYNLNHSTLNKTYLYYNTNGAKHSLDSIYFILKKYLTNENCIIDSNDYSIIRKAFNIPNDFCYTTYNLRYKFDLKEMETYIHYKKNGNEYL